MTKISMSSVNILVLTDPKNTNKQYLSNSPINLTIQVANSLSINDYFIVNLDEGFYT